MAQLPDGIEITWLGHSTFRVKTPEGKTLLIDPWIKENPACPDEFKDASWDDLDAALHGVAIALLTLLTCLYTAVGGIKAVIWTDVIQAAIMFGSALLAMIGLYGTIAFVVSSRTREIGLRMALGATRGRLLTQSIAEGALLSIAGSALGVWLAHVGLRTLAQAYPAAMPRSPTLHECPRETGATP